MPEEEAENEKIFDNSVKCFVFKIGYKEPTCQDYFIKCAQFMFIPLLY